MFRFILDKILQKKWMAASLLAGTVLFIAVACLNPFYVNGAMQKMLPDRLEQAAYEQGEYPFMIRTAVAINVFEKDFSAVRENSDQKWAERTSAINLPVLAGTVCWQGRDMLFSTDLGGDGGLFTKLAIANMPGMKEHIALLDGAVYSDEKQPDGSYSCIVSQSVYAKYKMIIGETLTFDDLKSPDGESIKLKITGVFTQADTEDIYWVNSAESYDSQCFVSDQAFAEIAAAYGMNKSDGRIVKEAAIFYDYTALRQEDAAQIYETACRLEEDNARVNCKEVLKEYMEDRDKAESTIIILQVPTMVLLALFIFMVAAKMLDMEQNEISVLKSRGVSGRQIVLVYFLHAVFITVLAAFIGLLLGMLMALAVGSANSFMEFVSRESIPIRMRGNVLLQLGLSAGFCILVMTIPVIPRCRVTIVEQKRIRVRRKKVFWKRLYLDVIGCAVSLYTFYNYRAQLPAIREKMRMGESVDPMLFLGSSLFILSMSLLFTRLIPCAVSLIYKIGRKKWDVAAYTAFLHSVRNREKQSFIMIFLICTIALGIFNANTARTINNNEEMGIRYRDGADIVIGENFPDNLAAVNYMLTRDMEAGAILYTEPDEFKYDDLEEQIGSMTKVYRQYDVAVESIGGILETEGISDQEKVKLERGDVVLMGIRTDEFGQTAYMPEGILDRHWYHYLNAMAENPYGVLMSANASEKLGLKVGDSVSYTRFDEANRAAGMGKGTIVGFVDYFPGFSDESYVKNADGTYRVKDVYLLVAGYDMVRNYLGKIPYERWIKNKASNSYIYEFSENYQIEYDYFADADNDVLKMKNDPVFQETNGMLTIGFLVALLICGVGMLIFQIMGIKERELIFGVCRAMGLTYGEMKKMLVLEQMLTSLPAVAGGVLTGIAATYLYAPLIQTAYESGTDFTLPVRIVCEAKDMLQLGAILVVVFAVCIVVVAHNVSHMKIAQALKLGEE